MGKLSSSNPTITILQDVDTDCLYSGMTWGASLVTPQALEWNTSVAHSATSLNYGILLQGIGGILAIPMIDAYGRSERLQCYGASADLL